MKKGNMLIAQSGGPSMVINQSLVGAVLAAGTAAPSERFSERYTVSKVSLTSALSTCAKRAVPRWRR